MSPDRALVIGEALIDVVQRTDGTSAEHPGGSPANVALGLGRLGREVDLLTWIGTDTRGTRIREHLAASGVRLAPGSDEAGSTSVAVATLDPDGVASYVFEIDWRLPHGAVSAAVEAGAGAAAVEAGAGAAAAEAADAPIVVHTGSIAAVLEPGGAQTLEVVRALRSAATITYDPNLRPALMGTPAAARPAVDALLDESDVVKVSDEDLAWFEPGTDPLDVARGWLGTSTRPGPSIVVVTFGGSGATAVTATGLEVAVTAPSVTVADTVGAGDSFMGGLIDGLWAAGLLGAENRTALHGIGEGTLRRVLERCARIAAITVSRPGAHPPTAAEL